MAEMRKFYTSEIITISFDPKKCIHARECVKGLPKVFDVDKQPWINPINARPDAIADVIKKCPSGALKYERHDGGINETAPDELTITILPGGPIYVKGDIEITDLESEKTIKVERAALCRCGESKNKPFCDNTHLEVNFNG